MANILRAMGAYAEHSGGAEEVARYTDDERAEWCAIAGCDEMAVATCPCCNRDVCADDFSVDWDGTAGICIDCAVECQFTLACQVVNRNEPVPQACHKCGAVVDGDALRAQTMEDGSLMWPAPFCRACLINGLRRLDVELRQPGKDGE